MYNFEVLIQSTTNAEDAADAEGVENAPEERRQEASQISLC